MLSENICFAWSKLWISGRKVGSHEQPREDRTTQWKLSNELSHSIKVTFERVTVSYCSWYVDTHSFWTWSICDDEKDYPEKMERQVWPCGSTRLKSQAWIRREKREYPIPRLPTRPSRTHRTLASRKSGHCCHLCQPLSFQNTDNFNLNMFSHSSGSMDQKAK